VASRHCQFCRNSFCGFTDLPYLPPSSGVPLELNLKSREVKPHATAIWNRQRAALLLAAVLLFLTFTYVVLLVQNLGAAPQTNVAVQGQTGAQPEGAFLNLVNWIGNVIAPVGAALAAIGILSGVSR
jgi:hypothetical protein